MERFSIENVTKHAAVFDLDKLNWMNSVYIRQADNKYLCSILEEILVRRGRIKPEEITPSHREYWEKVIALMKERIKYVAQLEEEASYFFTEEIEFDPVAFEEVLRREGVEEAKECEEVLSRIEIGAPVLDVAVREMAKKRGAAAQIHSSSTSSGIGEKWGQGLLSSLRYWERKSDRENPESQASNRLRKVTLSGIVVMNEVESELKSPSSQKPRALENTFTEFLSPKRGDKSTLLRIFRDNTKKKVVVLAPTKVAALNVRGQTIHSFPIQTGYKS